MVLVEHPAGALEVEVVLGVGAPGDVEDPVEVGPDDLVLGRLVGDAPEPRELALGGLPHVIGQRGIVDAPPQLVDLGLVALTQLVLDRLELLAQHELALALVDVLLHLGLDARAELQHLDLAGEDLAEAAEAHRYANLLEDLLLLGHRQAQRRGDQVRERGRVVQVGRRHLQLVGQVGHQVDHPRERRLHVAGESLELVRLLQHVGHGLHHGHEERIAGRVAGEPHALAAMHQHAHRAVGHAQHLLHRGHHAHVVEVVGRGLLRLGVAGGHQHEPAHLAVHHVVHQPDAALLADGERRHGLGEHHRPLEGEHRQLGRPFDLGRRHGLRGGHHDVLGHRVAAHLHGHRRAGLLGRVAHASPRTFTRTVSGPRRGASGSVMVSMPLS